MLNGKRIKEARKQKGFSQEELGNILDVTKVSICGYELETRTPNLQTFLKLVDVLDMDINYALGREIDVVSDNNIAYGTKLSSEDLKVIKALKSNKKIYRMLCDDPKRTLELIDRKLNK